MRTEVHYTQVYSNSAAFSGIDLSPVLSISSDASSRYLEFTGPMGAGMLQRDATTGGDTCGRTSANSAVWKELASIDIIAAGGEGNLYTWIEMGLLGRVAPIVYRGAANLYNLHSLLHSLMHSIYSLFHLCNCVSNY